MPSEWVFAKVILDGILKKGDELTIKKARRYS